VGDLGADEESAGRVGAGGDAGATTDAGGGVHGQVGVLLPDGYGVAVRGLPVGTEMKPPAAMMRSKKARLTARSLMTGKALARPGLEVDHVAVLKWRM